MSGALLVWLAGAMAIFVVANTVLRVYAGGGALWVLGAALVLFSLGNLMMVRLMREGGLAVAISVSAILQLLLLAIVAVVVFGERPTPVQFGGMALGVVAVALILWPQGARG
jgi:glucose uptake protein